MTVTLPQTMEPKSYADMTRQRVAPMIDPFGRAVTYLRVSVTDRCDFRCIYYMAENMSFLPRENLLSLEELDRLCSAFIAKGVRKLRLTGGEPLVRKNIMQLVRSIGVRLMVRSSPVSRRTFMIAACAVSTSRSIRNDLHACGLLFSMLLTETRSRRKIDKTIMS